MAWDWHNNVRTQLRNLWGDTVDVFRQEEVVQPDGSTDTVWVEIASGIACSCEPYERPAYTEELNVPPVTRETNRIYCDIDFPGRPGDRVVLHRMSVWPENQIVDITGIIGSFLWYQAHIEITFSIEEWY